MARHWEHFPHKADIGIRGKGATREEAFEAVGLALTAVLTTPDLVIPCSRITLHCAADDDESLLVEWLNAVIYEMAIRHWLFSNFKVRLSGFTLEAEAWGEPVDRERHDPSVEVKGATYTELKVNQDEDGVWTAQCVVDV